jgi:hypothetical protein
LQNSNYTPRIEASNLKTEKNKKLLINIKMSSGGKS